MSTPTSAEKAAALDLAQFIDASPTPHFAARAITERLGRAGFTELSERDAWSVKPGDKRFVVRGGTTVVAFAFYQSPVAPPLHLIRISCSIGKLSFADVVIVIPG